MNNTINAHKFSIWKNNYSTHSSARCKFCNIDYVEYLLNNQNCLSEDERIIKSIIE